EPGIVLPDEVWSIGNPVPKSDPWGPEKMEKMVWIRTNLVDTQATLRAGLTCGAAKWFDSPLSNIEVRNPGSEFPRFVVRASTCFDVIRTSITIDRVRGTKFRNCARKDCGTPFAIESRHIRNYCCQYCAHLESVRRNRLRNSESTKATRKK